MKIKNQDLIKEDSHLLTSFNKIQKKSKDGSWDKKYPKIDIRKLKRYLISKVGQNWDSIYSDACKKNNKKTFVGNILIEEVKKLVVFDAYNEYSKVFRNNRWGQSVELKNGDLYVDRKNILKEYKRRKYENKYKLKDIKFVEFLDDDKKYLEKLEDIWYCIDCGKYKTTKHEEFFINKFYNDIEGFVIIKTSPGNSIVPEKRQLNKKELSKLKNILNEIENITIPKSSRFDRKSIVYLNKLSSVIGTTKRR